MFTAALFTTAKKQSKGPLKNKQINKVWYKHAIEYYSALKRKVTLTRATTLTSPEDRTVREISQTQEDKYCTIPLTCRQIIETKSRQ